VKISKAAYEALSVYYNHIETFWRQTIVDSCEDSGNEHYYLELAAKAGLALAITDERNKPKPGG
jgi:hypothetical protein